MSTATAKDQDFELNLTLDAEDLRGLMQGNVTDTRSGIESLSCVVIVSDGEQVTLTSTDMAKQLTRRLPGQWPTGSAAVNAQLLGAALKGLGGNVTLARAPGKPAVLQAGRRRFNIPTVEVLDMPLLPHEDRKHVECDPVAVAEAVRRVEYAAAKKDYRAYLVGVHFGSTGIVAARTEGMAWVEIDMEIETDGMIVPLESIGVMLKLWPEGESALYRTETRAIFETGSATLAVQLLDFTYPDWRGLLPTDDAPCSAKFNAADMRAAIERLIPFVVTQTGKHNVDVSFVDDGILLSHAEAFEVVPVEESHGTDESLHINLDVLKPIVRGRDNLTWYKRPAPGKQIFRIEGKDNEGHLVMPIEV